MTTLFLSLLLINSTPHTAIQCSEESNSFCRLSVEAGSICDMNLGTCTGSNVPCRCEGGNTPRRLSVTCNAYCDTFYSGAKCRTWYPTPMCQVSGEFCSPEVCSSPQSSAIKSVASVFPELNHVIPLTLVNGVPIGPPISTTNQPSHSGTFTVRNSSSTTYQESEVSSLRSSTSKKASTTLPTGTTTSTTTSSTTTTTTTTTSTTTTTTTPDPYASCSSVGSADRDIFMWAEWPTLPKTTLAWTSYYRDLASFMRRNCARLRVTKLIIRITIPEFGAWWSPTNSPLYLALLSQIDPETELFVYPYVLDSENQRAWAAFSPSGTNVVEGVFEFTKQWNNFLSSMNSGVRFSGMVVDYEEFAGSRAPDVLSQILNMTQLKAQYGFTTGVTAGYPPTAVVNLFDSVMDEVYTEFYDFYYTPFVDSTLESPYLTFLNDPAGLADFTLATVLEGRSESRSLYGPKTNVMWSLQSLNGSCVYPLTDGTCGINYEFGAGWSAAAVNQYLHEISRKSPNLGSLPQGFFQFSFIPISWFI